MKEHIAEFFKNNGQPIDLLISKCPYRYGRQRIEAACTELYEEIHGHTPPDIKPIRLAWEIWRRAGQSDPEKYFEENRVFENHKVVWEELKDKIKTTEKLLKAERKIFGSDIENQRKVIDGLKSDLGESMSEIDKLRSNNSYLSSLITTIKTKNSTDKKTIVRILNEAKKMKAAKSNFEAKYDKVKFFFVASWIAFFGAISGFLVYKYLTKYPEVQDVIRLWNF
jgi:hypothetical protein